MTESEAIAVVLVAFLLFATAVGGILAVGFYVVVNSARHNRRLEERSELRDIRGEMCEMRSDFRSQMQAQRTDLKGEIQGRRTDLRAGIQRARAGGE